MRVADLGAAGLARVLRQADRDAGAVGGGGGGDGLLDLVRAAAKADDVEHDEAAGGIAGELEADGEVGVAAAGLGGGGEVPGADGAGGGHDRRRW